MSDFPCVQEGQCFDPANPLRNLSSEDSDGPLFIAMSPGNWYTPPPPLGSYFRTLSWPGAMTSETSLPDAILRAHNENLERTSQTWGTPPTDIPMPNPDPTPSGINNSDPPGPPHVPPPPSAPPPPIFYNEDMTITLFCADGNPFTVLVPANIINGLSQAEADAAARSYIERTAIGKRFCLSDVEELTVCPNSFYTQPITVTGGTGPFTWTTENLPEGLTLVPNSASSAVLSGFIEDLGTNSFSVRATDPDGNYMQKTYTVTVLGIVDEALPDGEVGVPYSHQLTSLGGGSTPIFELNAGALPDGLTMSSSGLITGTPTTGEVAGFSVAITSGETTCFSELTITVTAAGACPTTPAGLSWTFTDELVAGGATLTRSAAGATGSYDADCPVTGGTADVKFNACIQNSTAIAKTLRITFTTDYAASGAPLPFPGAATAHVEGVIPGPSTIDGCEILPPFGGSCGAIGSVTQWDVPMPALSDTTFSFRIVCTTGLGVSSASVVGTFVVTVF